MNADFDISFLDNENSTTITICGDFITKNVKKIDDSIKDRFKQKLPQHITFNLENVTSIDSAGSMLLLACKKSFEEEKSSVEIYGLKSNLETFLNLCKSHTYDFPKEDKTSFLNPSNFFYKIGFTTVYAFKIFLSFLSFVGEMFVSMFTNIFNLKRLRLNAITYHIQQTGINALLIIAITSFLIGIVIAFQGATLLRQFGANIFIIDFIGVAATRELAPLIVAIVIAGRSASAFTAEIGVMNITEEIDAMKTMGFSLWDFIILPRTYALILVLPLLVFFADVVSVFGGMIVAKFQLGISYGEFLDRFQESVDIKHIIIGLAKAPFFGWIIASIGCFRGFMITGNTQNVGKYTTMSVVNAIFWVIAFDALMSVFFTQVGL
ncbi:MAG: ABC transporter permease [Campylobacteraceae bacterium]